MRRVNNQHRRAVSLSGCFFPATVVVLFWIFIMYALMDSSKNRDKRIAQQLNNADYVYVRKAIIAIDKEPIEVNVVKDVKTGKEYLFHMGIHTSFMTPIEHTQPDGVR